MKTCDPIKIKFGKPGVLPEISAHYIVHICWSGKKSLVTTFLSEEGWLVQFHNGNTVPLKSTTFEASTWSQPLTFEDAEP